MNTNSSVMAEDLRKLFAVLQDCIEIITAHLVHHEVNDEGWGLMIQEITGACEEVDKHHEGLFDGY